jgi:hypothetical protein
MYNDDHFTVFENVVTSLIVLVEWPVVNISCCPPTFTTPTVHPLLADEYGGNVKVQEAVPLT